MIAKQDAKFETNFEKKLQTLSLHIQEDNNNISSALDAQYKKISSFATSYDGRLVKMSTTNKISTKIEKKTELEATSNTKLDELKT